MRSSIFATALVALAATVAACSDSSPATSVPPTASATTPAPPTGSDGGPTTAAETPVRGGTLLAGIADNPDHLDAGLSYTNQGWEILFNTNNGLLTYKKADGVAAAEIVPDIATSMPTVSADGLTYTFTIRKGVMYSPPVSREVVASDFKFTIERLFRIDSPGVDFYTVIEGAEDYAASKQGGISGIVADDTAGTVTFKLTKRDGTFLNYIALAFGFVYPAGTPDKDVSTDDAARVATGPYMIAKYVPKREVQIVRNPNFKVWTPDTPDGYLDGISVQIGIDPERAANMTAAGQLDWSFEPIAPDRYTELKSTSPDQVVDFVRVNTTYFSMNERKPPFDKLDVRKAVNYAIDRKALVKIFGGQGEPTENILPSKIGAAYAKHQLYPYDLDRARALIEGAGAKGAAVTVMSHNTDPAPKAAQYLAGVLDDIGLKATVKVLDESVYWDTIATQKGDPQIAFNDWNQDFPEGQNFIDVLLNGERIADVGNNNQSNSDVKELNALIDKAKQLPLGPERDAIWADLDKRFMDEDAGWAPFMNRTFPKFVSPRLRGLVFHPSYYEIFSSMWLAP